ncbi:MAG: Gldg family protein [Planctomycetota bacterium]
MKPKTALCALLLAALVVLAAALAGRLAGRIPLAAEWSRTGSIEPSPAMCARLGRLDGEVLLTWFGSDRARMPSSFRHVESTVMGLLRALEAAAPDKVRVQRLDPDADPEIARFASALGIAPIRARTVASDGYAERNVWSTLRIAYGAHGATSIRAVTPEHLPHLQASIAAQLDELETPRRPSVLIAAPSEFRTVRKALRRGTDVRESDFETSARIEAGSDLLVWIDPGAASPAHLAALERFLAEGKSVIVAGSGVRAEATAAGGASAIRFAPSSYPADVLLPHFGLRPIDGLFLDARRNETTPESGEPIATQRVRSSGLDQDFRSLASQPNGSLWFEAPTAFEPVAARLAELDLACTVLATSSERSWTRALPAEPISLGALQPDEGTVFLGRRPLLAILRPGDPWRGSAVFAASSSFLRDEFLVQEGAAHEVLLAILVGELASAERRAASRVAQESPAQLAELTSAERTSWRAFVLLALPLVATIGFWLQGRRRVRIAGDRTRVLLFVAITAGALLVAALNARIAPAHVGFDWTRSNANELAPATQALIAEVQRGSQSMEIALAFSERADLPPQMRPLVVRAEDLVRRVLRAGGDDFVLTRGAAVPKVRVTSHEDEETVVREIESAIVITYGERREVLSFPTAASFDELEFRVAFALQRLLAGRRPRIALACDVPRLSPAEALTQYQKKGLFAPSEGNAYGEARDLLAAHDFEVRSVDPRDPHIPEDCDALVWLQPRREARPMIATAAAFLARGGRVMIAAQHFDVRTRQARAKDLGVTLWPQPLFGDHDQFYFPKLGIESARVLVLDELCAAAELKSEVEEQGRTARVASAPAANPLLIRASAASYAPGSPFVAGLTDLSFHCGAPVSWNPLALASHGITATPFVFSSPRTWTFDWRGGDLPAEVLVPPDGVSTGFVGRLPLAVHFRGRFPGPEIDERLAEFVRPVPTPARASGPNDTGDAGGSGELVLVGGAEMFQNGRLGERAYDHRAFLLRTVTALACGPELASTIARGPREPGLDFVAPRERLRWRLFVVLAAPALFLACALARGVLLRVRTGAAA